MKRAAPSEIEGPGKRPAADAADSSALVPADERRSVGTTEETLKTRWEVRQLREELWEAKKRGEEARMTASNMASAAQLEALREKQRCEEIQLQRDFLEQSEKSLLGQARARRSSGRAATLGALFALARVPCVPLPAPLAPCPA